MNAVADVRLFRDLYGNAAVSELTHAELLRLRDALVRSGVCRRTVNDRLNRVKYMLGWALDEAIIPAAVKAELAKLKEEKRRQDARDGVRDAGDEKRWAAVKADLEHTYRVRRPGRVRGALLVGWAMIWAAIYGGAEALTTWDRRGFL
jgi:hypothetical protein